MYRKGIATLLNSVFGIYIFSFLCHSCGGSAPEANELIEILEYNDLKEDYYSLPVEQQDALGDYYEETRGDKSFSQVVRSVKKFKQPIEYISALIPIARHFTLSDAQYGNMFSLFPEVLQVRILSKQDPGVVATLLSEQTAPPIPDLAWLRALCDLLETVTQPKLRVDIIKKSYSIATLRLLRELNINDLEKIVNSWGSVIPECKLRYLSKLPDKGDWATKEFLVESMDIGANFNPQQLEKLLTIENLSLEKKALVRGLAIVPGIEKLEGKYFEILVNAQISGYTSDNPRYVAMLAAELLNNRQLDDDKKEILLNIRGPGIEFILTMFTGYTLFTTNEFKIIAEALNEKNIVDSLKSKAKDKVYRARASVMLDNWRSHVMGTKTYASDADMRSNLITSLA